jgi:predicted amidohydrolase
MASELATAEGWLLSDVALVNVEKLRKRYPEGFDAERSLHRASGDI